MQTNHISPSSLASIRNFAWVIPGLLARGEQPELEPSVFAALREAGITAVLSLRPDREQPSPNARRPWPEYHVEDEQALAESHGLRFRNFPIVDFSAPSPEQVAGALLTLDDLVTLEPGVYVHCRAGAGRAGLVSGAWGVSRGLSGDQAADNYVRFMEHIAAAFDYLDDDKWPAFARRVGQPSIWWALREIVAALGSPLTREQPRLLPPERPPDADHWEEGYRTLLRRWRRA
jgi:protein tyrosine phosphatase (PTP) superfamily phosphohydrolase (DUF442 family)